MFLGSTIDHSNTTFLVENKRMESSNEVKLLVITTDNERTSKKHINDLCNIATNCLRALTKISKFLSQEQVKCLRLTVC